jgi:hypothetical protein
MSIQDSTAGSRETPTRAGTERGRERSPNANVTNPSRDGKLADAWLDRNRQLVEANRFFALAIEPDAVVEDARGGRERKWPSTVVRRVSPRLGSLIHRHRQLERTPANPSAGVKHEILLESRSA